MTLIPPQCTCGSPLGSLEPCAVHGTMGKWHESMRELGAQQTQVLTRRIAALEAGIRAHRDQKGHDRCVLDDDALYALLPEGDNKADRSLPPREEFLEGCAKFYDLRKKGVSTEHCSLVQVLEDLETSRERSKHLKGILAEVDTSVEKAVACLNGARIFDITQAGSLVEKVEAAVATIRRLQDHNVSQFTKAMDLLRDTVARSKEAVLHAYDGGQRGVEDLYNPPWSPGWPDEAGYYWFYGYRWESQKAEGESPEMYLAQISHHPDDDRLIVMTVHPERGLLLQDKGAMGYWKRIREPHEDRTLPFPPTKKDP
jgi:hypothetical protein